MNTKETTIAFIGTGLMGQPMVRRLLQARYSVIVYNRTRAKAEALRANGAQVAESAADAIQKVQVVIVMLSDAAAIIKTVFNDNASDWAGKTLIQMGTIAPKESHSLMQQVEARGGAYLECPVLGSIPEATDGQLLLMAGGTQPVLEQCQDILKCFGPQPKWIGPVGTAATLKLALNQLIAAHICAFSLSLGLIQRGDVPVETFMDVLRKSPLYAKMFDKKLSRMLTQDFAQPNFPVKHLLKDVNLILQQAAESGLDAEPLAGVAEVIERSLAAGLGEADYSAVFATISSRVAGV